MKHEDLIQKLDPLGKVALVTSGLQKEPFEQAGIPSVEISDLKQLGETKGVSYLSAARAWDPALIEQMTGELTAEGGAEGNKLFLSPDLKTSVDPYGKGLSEDPRLNGEIGAAIVRGVHGAGAAAGLARISLSSNDIAWLDRRENAWAVHDLVAKPFLLAKGADALFLTPNRAGSGWTDTNRSLFFDTVNGYFGKDAFAVGDGTAPSSDALSLLHGRVCLGGAALPLERAVRRFRQLSAYREEGSVTERDLEDAIREGNALDDKTLDETVDEIVDFSLRLSEYPVAEPYGDEARKKLARDCIVLLRNEKILPLPRGAKIAVVGEGYENLSALEETFTVVGRARGYDCATERSDALIPDAVRSANEADAVLVFLRPDPTGRNLALPANRLALLDALRRTGKKIVALVVGDLPVDMDFDRSLAASLLIPADGPYAGEALADILSGEVNPSGKLTRTYLDGADGKYRDLKESRDQGRIRVGTFTGYRRFDTAEERVRYPFGFGLSYTEFRYSKLTAEGDDISFTVENVGGRDGAEVVEIYIGAPTVTHVLPKKELKAFVKVFLRAGESKRIGLNLPASEYATFDGRTLADNVEGGTYKIYVCSSSADVRLTGRRVFDLPLRERTEETLADYLPNGDFAEVKNVGRDNRISKADGGEIPRSVRIAKKAALYSVPVLAVLFFLLLTMTVFALVLDYSLFSAFKPDVALWVLYAITVAVIALIPLLGTLSRKRLKKFFTGSVAVTPFLLFACFILGLFVFRDGEEQIKDIVMRVLTCITVALPIGAVIAFVVERELARTKSGVNRWARFYFEEDKKEHFTSESEFEEAFRAAETAHETEKKEKEQPLPPPVETPQFYDRHLTFEVLMRDFKQFASERGYLIEETTLRNLFAAFACTRLIFVPAGDGAKVCSLLAEYFGRRAYTDNAESYTRCEDLFSQWRQGDRAYSSTQFTEALAAAKREPALLHTAIIRHADPNRLLSVFSPLADVVARRKTVIPLPDGTEVLLPQNIRIVVETEGEKTALPEEIAETAALLLPKCKEGKVAERKTVVQSVGYERFSALVSAVRDEFPLQEIAWKNVDQLDARCRSRHIGNLVWVRMELHASVVSACGGDETEAMDGALATELLPWLMEVWREDICGGALMGALTEIFGKNGIKQCAETEKIRGGKR